MRQDVTGIAPNALVDVADGRMPIAWLEVGTPVRCREMGMQPVAGLVPLRLSGAELMVRPGASPVRIRAASLGHGLPLNDVTLAAGQDVIRPAAAAPWVEPAPVPAARAGLPAPDGKADYVLIVLPMPDFILVEGLWMPSAGPGALEHTQDRAA
ncbi:MAG: Hint domain-containing protein [Pseudomonadota bacterium]